ncbi:hypothetical protein PSM7751_01281 [Pseudooceanicola marinus]|uniref:Uncharacterized protein n=1 Tax=Pseudooceanicola marinus TaxID=396013 RepID=A0A1X6YTA4_9RHOB|nr:hypothetical protein PSM7751_01281 [Pseudooceanicola marinus]
MSSHCIFGPCRAEAFGESIFGYRIGAGGVAPSAREQDA